MNEKIEYKHLMNPYVRDVFLSYLIDGARRTVPDGYPIIERWMVATEVPEEIYQWDCRNEAKGKESVSGMSFYCGDPGFTPVLNDPKKYVDKLRQYQCLIGMDGSPFDNMPPIVQKSQIYNNLAITYYYGSQGIKIVPNVRLGNDDTLGMLDAIPRHCLIAIGTNGFTWRLENRGLFKKQVSIIVERLKPTGIIVYGQAYEDVFESAINADIPIYQRDSHTIKRNKQLKEQKSQGVA